jgi:hypothetical protein
VLCAASDLLYTQALVLLGSSLSTNKALTKVFEGWGLKRHLFEDISSSSNPDIVSKNFKNILSDDHAYDWIEYNHSFLKVLH